MIMTVQEGMLWQRLSIAIADDNRQTLNLLGERFWKKKMGSM